MIGAENVLHEHDAAALYPCPSQVHTEIMAVLRPRSTEHVQKIVKWANENKVALYPLSTGKNWGYGGGNPACEQSVIVDMGAFKTIKFFDRELGLVTIEPGVSQGMLYQFLEEHKHPFYVPVTGSSPDCSLIGNALERGYGVTPTTNHFYAVQTIKTVLPDGTLYHGLLSELMEQEHAALGKWGAGPYTDGLFAQSNFGIVIEATIQLVRKSDEQTMIFFEPKNGSFEKAVNAARQLMESNEGAIASVKFFNQYYYVALNEPYPYEQAQKQDFNIDTWIQKKAKQGRCPLWLGIIFIYGTSDVAKASVKDVKQALKPHCKKIQVITTGFIKTLEKGLERLPDVWPLKGLIKQAYTAISAHKLMQGMPQERFLQAAYWRAGQPSASGKNLDPGRDGCGLIWFAPYVPFKGSDIQSFQNITKEVCARYGIFPIFSMTTLSTQGMSALLPIMFDPKTENDKAHACHRALFEACQAHGYLPYRAHLESMTWYTQGQDEDYWKAVRKTKQHLDPEHIISPGRYDGRGAKGA